MCPPVPIRHYPIPEDPARREQREFMRKRMETMTLAELRDHLTMCELSLEAARELSLSQR